MSMNSPIKITEENVSLPLKEGSYYIDILGGWKIELNYFSISLIDSKTKHELETNRIGIRVQSYKFGNKSKRIYKFKVDKAGEYRLIFRNIDSLKVKESNLFISSLFMKHKDVEELMIYIYIYKEYTGPALSFLANKYRKFKK